MSHIRFDNGREHVELRGPERAWMGQVCHGLALTVLHPFDLSSHPCWTRKIVPEGHYLHKSQRYDQDFETWLAVGSHTMRHPVTGAAIDGFSVILNTALRLGGPEVQLMARLHGQCEIHAFIPPKECVAVAGIIGSGLRMGLYREKMGWDAVLDLLMDSMGHNLSVVTSYSVTDTFPGWGGDTDSTKDWATELASLDPLMAIRPSTFGSYEFGDGMTAMRLRQLAEQ